MRRLFVIVLIALLPTTGTFAQGGASSEEAFSLGDALLVSAGIVVGVVAMDYLISGALKVPAVSPATLNPVIQEASAAGAVFGDQVAAGTATMDAKARADVMYVFLLGSGAVIGGWLFDQLGSFLSTPH